jgi:hypothetical protein
MEDLTNLSDIQLQRLLYETERDVAQFENQQTAIKILN